MRLQSILCCLSLGVSLCLSSCFADAKKQQESSPKKEVAKKQRPKFSADSAMAHVERQCAFGPRTLESKAHEQCVEYIVSTMERYGAKVFVQEFEAIDWQRKKWKAKNIIAHLDSVNITNRIVLFAHYDSRPCADKEENDADKRKPILGANDGASGVAVLMELARIYSELDAKYGLDIVFFDAEDVGKPSFMSGYADEFSWCLGSQYWAKESLKLNGPRPKFGILLDMVGGFAPQFQVDDASYSYAQDIVEKVWGIAERMSLGYMFQKRSSGGIVDDHYFVNRYAGIPTIDIIDFNGQTGFPDTWHTLRDTPENIDKGTMKSVGMVLMEVLCE